MNVITVDDKVTHGKGSILFVNPLGILVKIYTDALCVIQCNNEADKNNPKGLIFCIIHEIDFNYDPDTANTKITILERETTLYVTEYISGKIYLKRKLFVTDSYEDIIKEKAIVTVELIQFIRNLNLYPIYTDAFKSFVKILKAKEEKKYFEYKLKSNIN